MLLELPEYSAFVNSVPSALMLWSRDGPMFGAGVSIKASYVGEAQL